MEQRIQFCTTDDGVRIAYATVGKGTPLVKAANWLSHLEYDWQSPVWRHLLTGLAERHQLVRYDVRGTGLSDRNVNPISIETWIKDLETIVDALHLRRFALFGVSQGGAVAIRYAAMHPERVSHLILYGAYARGRLLRDDAQKERELVDAFRTLIHQGWGGDNHAFRQLFTAQYIPDATVEQMRWFNDLQRISASPEMADQIVQEIAHINVVDLLPQIKVPTLVLHCEGDRAVPFYLGRELAAGIPGARFVPMEGNNHLFLEGEKAEQKFFEEVTTFLGEKKSLFSTRSFLLKERKLRTVVKQAEESSIYKMVVMVAALASLVSFIVWLIG